MRNYFTFGSKDSRTYGVYISGQGTYNAPEKKYTRVSVPGRNGDLIMNDHRFENVELTYPAFISSDFKNQIALYKEALLSLDGYQRLDDSYNPDEYRKALYSGDMEVEATLLNNAGQFEITFSCDPRRFLKSGETTQTITSGSSISNPTQFKAQPLIRVTGYGTVTIGTQQITVDNHYTYVDIDCEMMDCFKGTYNANQYVSFTGNDFPVLNPGTNNITYDNTVTKLEITPRWWRV